MEYVDERRECQNENIPEISVIIPCYNSQETIVRSLESLEWQTYKNFEVVIVNDGSKDGTVAIIENYKKDSSLNIHLISQENGGVSVARNTGLANARGRFITFLDADDRYHPDFLELLYEAVTENNVDFAFCKYTFVQKEDAFGLADIASPKKKISKIEIMKTYLHKRTEKVNFFGGIYRYDLLKKYAIVFPSGVKYGEDSQFFCEYIFHCNQGGIYLETPLYEYWVREDSATHTINYNMVQNIDVYKRITEYWSNDTDFVIGGIGQYLVMRAVWGVAKKFALQSEKDNFMRLQSEYEVREAMRYMGKHGDEKSIRLSARVYCISPQLFRILVRTYESLNGIIKYVV